MDDVAILTLRNLPVQEQFQRGVPVRARVARADARRCCGAGSATRGPGEMEIAEITTACGEAATNAIEHAGASGGTTLEVSGSRNGQRGRARGA